MKFIKYAIFLGVLLLALAGCSKDDKAGADSPKKGTTSGGELKVAVPSEPPTLDTHVNTTTISSNIARNIFETLLTFDSKGEIQPMLAESFKEDGKTIEFKLRKGVKFHNGEELKAKDVVASMNRWIHVSSSGKETFKDANFSEVDEYTVLLEMAQPTSTATLVLAYSGGEAPTIMPASILEGKEEKERVTEYIGTGPFQFKDWKQNQQIHMTKFEDYSHRDEPGDGLAGKREALVDDLYIIFVPDSSTRVAGILSGEYDAGMELPIDNVEQLKANKDVVLKSVPRELLLLYFNKKEGLFTNQAARDAVNAAVKKEDVLKAAFVNPDYYKTNHHVMLANQEAQWYSDLGKEEYGKQDAELAKKLFAEAGYNGEEIRLMTSRDYDHMYNASIVVQEQLKKAGVNVKLEVYDWPTFSERRNDPSAFDITIITNKGKVEPTSLVWSRPDYVGWTNNEKLAPITSKIRTAPSLDDARKYYDELQAFFLEYKPAIKMGDGDMLFAGRTSLSQLEDIDGLVFWNVSNSK
ncbi:ABC transporter substrate-binding protein [Sporosarcina thermotolerans]|uniref:ABC transporter substrate-binding protein n=1 Tax=Sporosarcina thermotolerans TaxID=633404 RepID=A0AAW9A722_9BACL|nr:ABC transporter substrate-binding protein [Sporosarcina thermotolerans]MDW0116115.1 ABC transporter substrate-binding protein [Sporosarcina thermotolerans]